MTRLANRYWDLYLANRPTYATLIGEHDYDEEIEDLSDDGRDRHLSSLRALRTEVEHAVGGDDSITRELLLAVLSADIAEAETEVLVWPADPNIGAHSETLRYASQTRALVPEHARALIRRYRQIPRLLQQALARHLRVIDGARPPAAVSVRRVIDQVDGYVASGLETDPYINLRLPDDWGEAGSWRSEMEEIVTTLIRPGFSRYRDGLAADVLPAARADEKAGICHIEGGEATYRRLAERFITVPFDPDEIHRLGQAHATETLISQYADIGSQSLGIADQVALFARLRGDSSLRYRSAEEMLGHARDTVERAWASIDGWLGARPDGPCEVEAVPASLAKDMPPAYYLEPSPDGSRPGIYFLNTHEPHTRDRFSAEATAFHEAIPGHHFDRALAGALTDLPAFRRFLLHNVHAEGWGLYSERLADEMGLYSGPLDRLGMLTADSWRAARLVVDTGMHHHGWSRERAVQFMADWTPINRPTIEQEIDRYIGWPGQALSYKVGQIEIDRLRTMAEERLGDRFDLMGFHDTILTSGSVTMPVLGDLVTSWMSAVSGSVPESGESSAPFD